MNSSKPRWLVTFNTFTRNLSERPGVFQELLEASKVRRQRCHQVIYYHWLYVFAFLTTNGGKTRLKPKFCPPYWLFTTIGCTFLRFSQPMVVKRA